MSKRTADAQVDLAALQQAAHLEALALAAATAGVAILSSLADFFEGHLVLVRSDAGSYRFKPNMVRDLDDWPADEDDAGDAAP